MVYQSLRLEYLQIPPISRAYTTACILTTAAVQLELITPFQLYFNPELIFKQFQIWKLITNFLFFGPVGFNFLFNMIFLYRYCRMLEERLFPRSDSRLCIYVPFWWILNDSFWLVCELSFLGPGLYNNACLRVEPEEPIRLHELLRPSEFPGPLFTLGAHGLFLVVGELNHCGPLGY